MNELMIEIPDIGGATVDVIDILVKEGQHVEKDTPILMLESDKATMEIPSPYSGAIHQLLCKIGDKVKEGSKIASVVTNVESANSVSMDTSEHLSKGSPDVTEHNKIQTILPNESLKNEIISMLIPDLGGGTGVEVIDIMVAVGDIIQKDQSLILLEGEKATMEVPSLYEGKIVSITLKKGDKVSLHDKIGDIEVKVDTIPMSHPDVIATPNHLETNNALIPKKDIEQSYPATSTAITTEFSSHLVLTSPAIRRMARELGVDLLKVKGSGRKMRITKDDVTSYVKHTLSLSNNTPQETSTLFPKVPDIDFSQFGEIELKPLSKIKKLTGQNLHRSWLIVPHVTQFDEADITDLEAFRKEESLKLQSTGVKLTMLAFICKAVAKALVIYPQFNASLGAMGDTLIYKKYINIGIAVDTPNGLVVPVIKAVDRLSVTDIAAEMGRLSQKARETGLSPKEMSGGCFTISSLGGIGGTSFTPIVNTPEVAILGISKSSIKPIFEGDKFVPRLMLPLSLSYDHRVIDGVEAAKMTQLLGGLLSDFRRVLL
jgi:pyruvate dehydrogenase E2 component (dihydrolipoamide acetyltransferase)